MTKDEAEMVIEFLNKRGAIPSDTQRNIAFRACAREIRRRIGKSARKVSEYVSMTEEQLTVVGKDGVMYALALQKGSVFSRLVQLETCNEEKFFLKDRIQWKKI